MFTSLWLWNWSRLSLFSFWALSSNFEHFHTLLFSNFEHCHTLLFSGWIPWDTGAAPRCMHGVGAGCYFQTSYLSFFLHKCTFWAQFFSTWKRVNCSKISQNCVIFVTNMSSGYFSLFSLSNCFVLFTLISFYFCFFFCTHSAGLTLWALIYQYVAIVAQLFLMWNILPSSVPERSTPYRDPFTDDQLTDHFGR